MKLNGIHLKFAQLYFNGGQTMDQIAKELDVAVRQLYKWLHEPQIIAIIEFFIEEAALKARAVFGRAAEEVAGSVVEIATKKDVQLNDEGAEIVDAETSEPVRVFRYGASTARQAAGDVLQGIQVNVKAAPEKEAINFSDLYKGYTHEDFARRAKLLAERARKAQGRNSRT